MTSCYFLFIYRATSNHHLYALRVLFILELMRKILSINVSCTNNNFGTTFICHYINDLKLHILHDASVRHPNTFWTIKPSPNILLRLRQFNQFPLLCGQGWERLKIDRSTIVFFNQKINILINIFSRDLFKRQRDLFLCRWSIWETRTSWVWGLRNLLCSFRAGHDGTSIAWEGGESAGSMLFRTESPLQNMV